MKIDHNYTDILNHLSTAALLEQLAEEASELSQAALKLARVYRGENPTPVSELQANAHLREEFTDVFLVADILGLPVDWDQICYKTRRWKERLKK